MTIDNRTRPSTDHRNITYLTLVRLYTRADRRIADAANEYNTMTSTDEDLTHVLKRLELNATGKTLTGQIARLYGLVNLLFPDQQPTDRTGEELKQLAIELEHATEIIEDAVSTLVAAIDDEET